MAARRWLSWVARLGGVVAALVLARWALVLFGVEVGFAFLDEQAAASQRGVESATAGLLRGGQTAETSGVLGTLGAAFGVLLLLVALVLLAAAVFPWQRLERGQKKS